MKPSPAFSLSARASEPPHDPYLARIRDLIQEEGGSFRVDSKPEELEDRCRRRMQKIGVNTLDTYFKLLTTLPSGQAELGKLLKELQHGTTFFANLSQLDDFRRAVLPIIVEAKKKMALAHIRVWCAECGSGEDAYSLGMILQEETHGLLASCTFEVLATDSDEHAVNFARQGLYDPQGARSVNSHFRQSYFVALGNQLKVNLQIKARVNFSVIDLLNDSQITFMKGMNAIFCCNVLSGFDRPTKQRVLQHFWTALQPQGFLFLGESESLYGASQDFELVDLHSSGVYQKMQQRTR
jgi:chemotaxis protein methyltransferase CheR